MKFLTKDFAIIVILNKKGGQNPPCQSLPNPSTLLLASISVAPWVGSHKLLELLHIGDALDILFLLEPFLDCWSIKVQSITLADKRNVVTPHRSVHRRFG